MQQKNCNVVASAKKLDGYSLLMNLVDTVVSVVTVVVTVITVVVTVVVEAVITVVVTVIESHGEEHQSDTIETIVTVVESMLERQQTHHHGNKSETVVTVMVNVVVVESPREGHKDKSNCQHYAVARLVMQRHPKILTAYQLLGFLRRNAWSKLSP